jgi:colanic acid biosynthesis glycosyl transferase WcaI
MLHSPRTAFSRPPLKLLIHDYGGHPFVTSLSRQLARQGHDVTHAYFAGDIGPKGQLSRRQGDPKGLRFEGLGQGIAYSKSNFLRRRQGDLAYGRALADCVRRVRPDVVLSGSTPTEAQEGLWRAGRTLGCGLIYWCQDFYSLAAARLLQKRLPGIGHGVGAYYTALERRQMRQADHVIHITEDFRPRTEAWGLERSRVSVIQNWGTLDEIPLLPRNTAWATRQGLGQGARFLYSGTLAMKHNPVLLTGLAEALGTPDEMLVVAAGSGADALRARGDLPKRMRLLPLQPIAQFAEMLGAADVFLAMIERSAGDFSVPSKTLSYLCAGRPIVLAAPAENLAAKIVQSSGAGIVVAPEDIDGFRRAALHFALNPEAAARAGAAGRAYAERHFKIDRIADKFEARFHAAHEAHATV